MISFINKSLQEDEPMPRSSSTALSMARIGLRVLIALNWVYGAGVLATLAGLIAADQWTMTALGVASSAQSGALLQGMRAIAALGLVAVPMNLVVLERLVAMIQTVRAGDPFVGANARRLQVLAWVFLA